MALLDFVKKKKDQLVGAYNNDASTLGIAKNTVLGLKDAARSMPSRAVGVAQRIPKVEDTRFFKGTTDFMSNINTRPLSSRADSTLGKLAGGIIETPYTFLTSVPKTAATGFKMTANNEMFTKPGIKKFGGMTLESGLDTASMGLFSKANALRKAGMGAIGSRVPAGTITSLIKQGAKQGLKTGGAYGAGYGLSEGLKQGEGLKDIAKRTATGGATGALLGGVLGGGIPASSGLYKAAKHDLAVRRGKSFGKAESLPERTRWNDVATPREKESGISLMERGKTLKAETIDPNAPLLPMTLREIGTAMPRPGMSIQDVSARNLKRGKSKAYKVMTGQSSTKKVAELTPGVQEKTQLPKDINATSEFFKKTNSVHPKEKPLQFVDTLHNPDSIVHFPSEKRLNFFDESGKGYAVGTRDIGGGYGSHQSVTQFTPRNKSYIENKKKTGIPVFSKRSGGAAMPSSSPIESAPPAVQHPSSGFSGVGTFDQSIAPNGGKVNPPTIRQFALPAGNRPLALPNAPGHFSGEGFTMKPGGKRNITDLFDGPAEGIYTVPVKDKNGVAKKISVRSQYDPNPQDAPQTMGAVRRFFTGGEKVLEKSGKGGKEMKRLMEAQRKQEDLMRGGWNVHIDKALSGLSKEEVSNVDAVLRGEATPINANTAKSASMLREWFNSIGKTAEEKQFQIQTPDGVKVPFKMRENYAPQMYNFTDFEKGAMRDKALQHLVDTKQARNLGEATKLLDDFIKQNGERRFGNLEKARTIDLPGFERDPAIYAKKYAQSIAKRFSEVDNFGMKDSRIAELVNRIAQEGGDYTSAQRIFDYTTKGADQNKIVNGITQYNLATQLDLSALTNITQNINTATKAGGWNTIKGAVKGFTKEGKEIADLAGVDDDFIHSRETGVDLNKVVKFVMWPFKKVEGFNRRTAANAGVLRAQEMAQQKEMTDFAVRELKSLGIDPANIKNGRLSKEDMLSAAYEMARKTQFKVDPLDVPSAWKTPAGKLFTQFQSFSFMQTKFIRDAILKEAKQGNFAPLVRFIPLAIAASYATSYIRNIITGRDPEEANKNLDIRAWDKWGKSFGDFATGKIIQGKFLYDTYNNPYSTPIQKMTRTASTILGPSIGKGGAVINALESMQTGFEDNKKSEISIAKGTKEAKDPYLDTKRFVAGEVPFVGEFIKNKAFAYPASKYMPEEKAQFAKENAVSEAKVVNIQLQRGTITPGEAQQKMQDIQESYQKDLTKISEKSGSVLPTAQAKESDGNLDSRIQFNPVSGKYNYFDKNGDYKSDTKEKAERALKIEDFLASDENSMEYNGKFYTKDDSMDSGYRSEKIEKREATYSAQKRESYKDQDDIKGWMKETEDLYAKLGKMKDAETDDHERIKIENDMRDIAVQYNEYKSYGGFTKPKKAKKVKVPSINDADFIVKKMSSKLRPLRAFGRSRTNLASVSRPNIRRPKRLS